MNNNLLVSVIVPIYNVEQYVEKAIICILKQDYKNIEIILIDDCSTDNSLNIIEKFAKYDHIHLIKCSKNGGAAYARNKGLEIAKGDYIGFVDPDDFIDIDYYSNLVKSAVENNADIVVCDINIIYPDGNTDRRKCGTQSNNKLDFINNGLAASSCNKLFKREILKNKIYEETKKNEDLSFVLPLIINSKRVVYNNKVYYNYYQRCNSFQNSALSDEKFDIFDSVDMTLKKIENVKNYNEYESAIVYNQLIVFLMYVIGKEDSFKKRYYYLKKYHILSKKYNINKNLYFLSFLANSKKAYMIYYKLLIELNAKGLIFLDSLLMWLYIKYKKRNKKIIKDNIDIIDLIQCAKNQKKLKLKKKISVVVPNYNYAKFMYQRIYSILNQDYKIYELIILDDSSTDNSRDLIDEIKEKLSPYIFIKTCYNEKNSGKAFIQWEKGVNLATGDYIWIAEADDYCKSTFLKNVMRLKDDVIISYSDTGFIDTNGNLILKSIKKEIDIQSSLHWNKSYINDGTLEFQNYTYLNCTIANVSSAVFKKNDYTEEFKIAKQFRQAGDWVFYACVMQRGKIAYTNKILNYYRVHGNNVTSTTKKQDHLNEIMKVHKFFETKFNLSKVQKKKIDERYAFLKEVWKLED